MPWPKGRKRSPETTAKMAMNTPPLSEESRAKIRESRRGRTPFLGRTHTAEAIAKMVEGQQQNGNPFAGRKHSPDARQRMSDARVALWAPLTPEERRWRMLPLTVASVRARGASDLERAVEECLAAMGEMYRVQHVVGPWIADFYLPDRNLILECDGGHWHSLEGRAERDQERDGWLAQQGYCVVRLTESEIEADVVAAVTRAIRGGGEQGP